MFHCINSGGHDQLGLPLTNSLALRKDIVQELKRVAQSWPELPWGESVADRSRATFTDTLAAYAAPHAGSFQNWCEQMIKPGFYGDGLVLVGAALVFNISINVICAEYIPPMYSVTVPEMARQKIGLAPPTRTLWLAILPDNHVYCAPPNDNGPTQRCRWGRGGGRVLTHAP